jgi:lipopolysaccharide transport protein LptA
MIKSTHRARYQISLVALLFIAMQWPVFAELAEDTDELKEPPVKQPQSGLQHTDEAKAKARSAPQPQQPATGAQKPTGKGKAKPAKPGVVKFWSKSLSGFRDQGSLMLEEDVVVTQDDIRLEADKATIFFEKGSNEVSEVHAVGAVKFSRIDPETGQPIKAEGKEAVFNNSKRNVVMKGQPVLYRGDDVIRGKVIYYDLTNGWVKADRVEGVVQPAVKKAGVK